MLRAAVSASPPPVDAVQSQSSVWNHAGTRPFCAVDAVGRSEAARLTAGHLALVAETTLGGGSPPGRLTAMLRQTARQYIERELQTFACHIVPALFDVLDARRATASLAYTG